jgi:hypothetical protein
MYVQQRLVGAVVERLSLPAEADRESRLLAVAVLVRRGVPIPVVLSMLQRVVISVMLQVAMKLPVLAPRHRILVSILVVQGPVKVPMLQVVVETPMTIGMLRNVVAVLSLGRSRKQSQRPNSRQC